MAHGPLRRGAQFGKIDQIGLKPALITSLIYRLCSEGKNQKSKSQRAERRL